MFDSFSLSTSQKIRHFLGDAFGLINLTALLPNDFLDLADLFLNFAIDVFHFSSGLQVRIPDGFPDDLLDFTLHLMQFAFHFVSFA